MAKALPVAGSARRNHVRDQRNCGTVRPSRRSRWRALSLVLVHVAAAIHIAHWYYSGTTLSPVEPSEAMQTLGTEALVNAGALFFALLIVSTLVVGRFFCGWGCHIVALQDLCTWFLRRISVRVRPFRSRLLLFVPLLAALYMFVVPTLVRVSLGQSRAPFRTGLMTSDFWDRFPAWPIALLTFVVCGFLFVVLLGNKGFCSYGCPYGGIFGVADRVAPGRIRVTDACEGCAHCTATCTSNVRVHEEVRLYGMVVDPGCMKCMDCVSVCPKDALYFGFGAPSIAGSPAEQPRTRKYDFTWPEEIFLALAFGASIVILRGLYDSVPFLLALGLSAISAYVLLTAVRSLRGKNDKVATLALRRQGKLSGQGLIVLAVTGLWAVFLVHSGSVKYWTFDGLRDLARGQQLIAASGGQLTPAAQRSIESGAAKLERSQRYSLVPMGRHAAGIADSYFALGRHDLAEPQYRRAVELSPRYAQGRVRLASYLTARNELDAAKDQLIEALALAPETVGAAGDLSDVLIRMGRPEEGVEILRQLVEEHPRNPDFRSNYGVLLAHKGDLEKAAEQLQLVVQELPGSAAAHLKLGQVLANQDRLQEALESFERSVQLDPGLQAGRMLAAKAAVALRQPDRALLTLEEGIRRTPFDALMTQAWTQLLAGSGRLQDAIGRDEAVQGTDRTARFRLVFLYQSAGRMEEARRMAQEFPSLVSGQ